jgi:hypothetical protein
MRKYSLVSGSAVCLLGFLVSCGEQAADTLATGGVSGTAPTGGVSGTAAVTGGSGGSTAGTPATGGALATGGIAGTAAGQGGAAGLAAGQGGTFAGSAGASSGFGGVGGAVAGSGGEPFGGAGSGGATAGTGGGGASTGGAGGAGGAGGSGGKACGTPGATFAQVQTIISKSCGTTTCHPNAQGQHINLHNTDGMLYMRLMGNVPTAATDMQCRNRPMVVPCSPDTSLIVQMIEAATAPRAGCAIRMPDDCPMDRACLVDADIQTIRSWIAGGAPQ